MLIQVKTIMFDWGGTLARVATQDRTRRPCAAAAVDFLREHGCSLPDESVDDLHRRFVDSSSRTEQPSCLEELDSDNLLANWARSVQIELPAGQDRVALRSAFWRPWIGCLELFDGAVAVLRQLRIAGYSLGLVSNCAANPASCHAEIGRQGIAPLLDFTLFTSELGKRKPHESVYEEAYTRAAKCAAGLTRGEVLFVGDTPIADLEGPKRFGMKTALVRTGNWNGNESKLNERPDAILDSFRDLPAILQPNAGNARPHPPIRTSGASPQTNRHEHANGDEQPMASNLEPFCKLSEPQNYTTCEWDLTANAQDREAWIDIFAEHTSSLLEHARTSDHPPKPDASIGYERAFLALMENVRKDPASFAPLSIYELCRLRAEMMREYGIGDPYDRVKREENEAALRHLPGVLKAIDACDDSRIVETLLRGVLAGNKFDLGAKATTDQHAAGGIDFFATLDELPSRPWVVDDVDALASALGRKRCSYRKGFYFVDNAGGDVVLGAIPFARHLANEGCAVVLAANDEPALNDILVDELNDVLEQAARMDARLADHISNGGISVVGTGCDCPLIDLGAVTHACNEAAHDADLLILEGMGRAIETNYETPFTCDTIHIAMIKNPRVAEHMGCRMFGLVARFTPA